MIIKIAFYTGDALILEAQPFNTILDIKRTIEKIKGIPLVSQILSFNGMQLMDNNTLNDYNIQNGQTIYLFIKKSDRIQEAFKVGIYYPNNNIQYNTNLANNLYYYYNQDFGIRKEYYLEKEDKTIKDNNIINQNESYSKEINIKFIKDEKNSNKFYKTIFKSYQNDVELFGLTKLCLLKEISSKLNETQIMQLEKTLSYILLILRNGSVNDIAKKEIILILEKIKGSNILNFSKYVDEIVPSSSINMLMQMLNYNDLEYIQDIKRRLSNYTEYTKLFEKDIEEKKNKVFSNFQLYL